MRKNVAAVGDYGPADARAVKALYAGKASEAQQQRALRWIIEGACGFRDEPYRPDSARDTTFNLGRQAVARQIMYLATLPENLIEQMKEPRKDG